MRQRAGDKGHITAQYNLGVCYEDGIGTEQDYAQALRWYELAAKNGNPDAMYSLGVMYGDGKGTKNNEREAAKWLRKAADAGHEEAAELLKSYNDLKNSDQ